MVHAHHKKMFVNYRSLIQPIRDIRVQLYFCRQVQLTFNLPKNLRAVSKGAKIRKRCNQVPQLTQDTNGKVTNSQLDTTNESQGVSPFPAGYHKAQINRHVQKHSNHKRETTQNIHNRSTGLEGQ